MTRPDAPWSIELSLALGDAVAEARQLQEAHPEWRRLEAGMGLEGRALIGLQIRRDLEPDLMRLADRECPAGYEMLRESLIKVLRTAICRPGVGPRGCENPRHVGSPSARGVGGAVGHLKDHIEELALEPVGLQRALAEARDINCGGPAAIGAEDGIFISAALAEFRRQVTNLLCEHAYRTYALEAHSHDEAARHRLGSETDTEKGSGLS